MLWQRLRTQRRAPRTCRSIVQARPPPESRRSTMARVGTLSGYPNVLVVIGRDVHSRDADDDYRAKLRDLLYDRDQRPVRRGSHDFWITYPVPQVRDASSEH